MIDPDDEHTAISRRAAPGEPVSRRPEPDADTTRVVRDASRAGTTVPAPGPHRERDAAAPAPAGSPSPQDRVATPPRAGETYPVRQVPLPAAARAELGRRAPQEYVDSAAVEASLQRRRRRRAIAAAVAASVLVVTAALALVLLLTVG